MTRLADVVIGDLLKAARLVNDSDVENAIQVATKTGLPMGRVLVMLGLVSNEVVQAALDAQTLVRERFISTQTGIKALTVCAAQRLDLEHALKSMGEMPVSGNSTNNRLGDLLLGSGLISTEQINEALAYSQHLGLPLGRILILKGILSELLLEAALEAQVLLRDEQISRMHALDALRTVSMCGTSLHESLRRLGCENVVKRHVIRLGELIVLSELVTESDCMTALEIALTDEHPIGEVLINFGFIDRHILTAALKLQEMVSNKRLTIPQAGEALKMVANIGMSLPQAIGEIMAPEISHDDSESLLTLLRVAGFLTDDEHDRVMKFRGTSLLNVVVSETGAMNEPTLRVAIKCHLLMKENLITNQQAIVALHHWRWSGVSLRDTLHNMGWNEEHKQVAIQKAAAAMTVPSWNATFQFSHSWH